jgi:peptide/nickel transport system substrate-binding protein
MGTVDIVTNYSMANEQTFLFATEKDYMNVSVRQALMHALDYEGLFQTVTYGFARPAPSIMMHPSLFPNPDLPVYDYDPEKAKALLAEGGWDASRKLQFGVYTTEAQATAVHTQIINLWRAVGVETEYLPLDPANQATIAVANPHVYDLNMASFAWLAYNPVSTYRWVACGEVANNSHYCNPEYDEIMRQAIRTADPEAQKALLQQAQVIAQRDLPIAPIWIEPEIWAINPRMHGGVLGRGPLNDVLSELWWKE